jgi:hypothetical protein
VTAATLLLLWVEGVRVPPPAVIPAELVGVCDRLGTAGVADRAGALAVCDRGGGPAVCDRAGAAAVTSRVFTRSVR